MNLQPIIQSEVSQKDKNKTLKPGLCNNLKGWDGVGDGRQVQEGGDICIFITGSC